MLSLLLGVTCFFFLWNSNPVHGVLSLVLVGLTLAGTLLGRGLEFPALLIVLVYVGAVTVLFIFVVIMVNLRATPASYVTAEAPAVWFLLVGLLVWTTLATENPLFLNFVSLSFGYPGEGSLNLQTLGFYLYGTERVYFVFVVGLILFVAIVSAICLSLVGGENYRTQEFYSQIRRSNGVFNFNSSSVRSSIPRFQRRGATLLGGGFFSFSEGVENLNEIFFVLLGVSCVLFFLLRRGWWWTSLGGTLSVWVLQVLFFFPSVGAAALSLFFIFFRFAGGVKLLSGLFSPRGAVLAVGSILPTGGEENEDNNSSSTENEEVSEWKQNGWASEEEFEAAVDRREILIWGLILGGAIVLLLISLAFFYFEVAPPSGWPSFPTLPPGWPSVPIFPPNWPELISPCSSEEPTPSKPPAGTSNSVVRAVRAYAKYTLRRS